MGNFDNPLQVELHLKRFGERIRLARLRRKLSLVELAEKAAIHRNTLAALEQGKPGTALCVAFTVLWALGLDASVGSRTYPQKLGITDPKNLCGSNPSGV